MSSNAPSVDRETPEEHEALSPLIGLGVGGALVVYGVRRRGFSGMAAGIIGAGLLAVTLAPRLAPRVSIGRSGPRSIDVDLDVVVNRPRPAVFDFFHNFENLPLLGGILHSVDDYDDGRSRWRVMGGETLVEWDVLVTKYLPPRVIGWESVPGAAVESSGTVRFDALDPATTRVCVSVHYIPRSEAAIDAFAAMRPRHPARKVRAAIGRVEAAMQRAAAPDVHFREPLFPLPEPPSDDAPASPGVAAGDDRPMP